MVFVLVCACFWFWCFIVLFVGLVWFFRLGLVDVGLGFALVLFVLGCLVFSGLMFSALC